MVNLPYLVPRGNVLCLVFFGIGSLFDASRCCQDFGTVFPDKDKQDMDFTSEEWLIIDG